MAAVCYKLVGVSAGRIIEHERKRPGAPSEGVMIDWAKRFHCSFVGRYYPTLGGWRVLRIDNAVKVNFNNRATGWRNYGRGQRIYPNEHAMAMHCMALLGVTPDT